MIPELEKSIQKFINNFHQSEASELHFLAKGMFSATWSYTINETRFVVRVGENPETFLKDKLAYQHFAATFLSIPRIIEINTFEGYHFAISEFISGRRCCDISNETARDILLPTFKILDRLSELKPFENSGWGPVNRDGLAKFTYKNWKSYLTSFQDWPYTFLARKDEVYRSWKDLYQHSFLEEALVKKCMVLISELSLFCPEERHVIHGDFGADNLLTDGKQITAVLDWAEMRYGDHLYDLAYLDNCSNHGINYVVEGLTYYKKRKVKQDNFNERIMCYKTFLYLGEIFLFANRNNEADYMETIKKVKKEFNF